MAIFGMAGIGRRSNKNLDEATTQVTGFRKSRQIKHVTELRTENLKDRAGECSAYGKRTYCRHQWCALKLLRKRLARRETRAVGPDHHVSALPERFCQHLALANDRQSSDSTREGIFTVLNALPFPLIPSVHYCVWLINLK